jgi:hypothetical protein
MQRLGDSVWDEEDVRFEDGTTVDSTDEAEVVVAVLVYPPKVSFARAVPLDSALNHVQGPIASVRVVGPRVRVGPLVAEVIGASLARLGLSEGDEVVATFKDTAQGSYPSPWL